MKTEPAFVCDKHLAPYLAGFLGQQPGRKGTVKLEPVPEDSPIHRDYPCIVCGHGVLFEVAPVGEPSPSRPSEEP